MNQELAKKLKEAGFPQRGKGEFNLSSLVEACGEVELILRNISWSGVKQWECWIGGNWKQGPIYKTPRREMRFLQTAPTPEESVANLWLALNNKDAKN